MSPPEIRTFSILNKQVGWIEFSIPLQSPMDVASYLSRILEPLPVVDRMKLHSELMRQADSMGQGYALWLGDPEAARLELRNNKEVSAWLTA